MKHLRCCLPAIIFTGGASAFQIPQYGTKVAVPRSKLPQSMNFQPWHEPRSTSKLFGLKDPVQKIETQQKRRLLALGSALATALFRFARPLIVHAASAVNPLPADYVLPPTTPLTPFTTTLTPFTTPFTTAEALRSGQKIALFFSLTLLTTIALFRTLEEGYVYLTQLVANLRHPLVSDNGELRVQNLKTLDWDSYSHLLDRSREGRAGAFKNWFGAMNYGKTKPAEQAYTKSDKDKLQQANDYFQQKQFEQHHHLIHKIDRINNSSFNQYLESLHRFSTPDETHDGSGSHIGAIGDTEEYLHRLSDSLTKSSWEDYKHRLEMGGFAANGEGTMEEIIPAGAAAAATETTAATTTTMGKKRNILGGYEPVQSTNWDAYSHLILDPLEKKTGAGRAGRAGTAVGVRTEADKQEEAKLEQASKAFRQQQYKLHHHRSYGEGQGSADANAKIYFDEASHHPHPENSRKSSWEEYQQFVEGWKSPEVMEVDELKQEVTNLKSLMQIEQSMYQTSNEALRLVMDAQSQELQRAKDSSGSSDSSAAPLSTSEELEAFDQKAREFEASVVKDATESKKKEDPSLEDRKGANFFV